MDSALRGSSLAAGLTAVLCVFALANAVPRADAKSSVWIPCLNQAGSTYQLKVHPGACAEFSYSGGFGGGVNLAHIDWETYGGQKAKAHAVEKGFHLPFTHTPVRVVAFRRVNACGKRVYSRLRATSTHGSSTVRLHVCGGSAI